MTVKLGINPITWTKDDVPTLGGDTPLEVCLAARVRTPRLSSDLGRKVLAANEDSRQVVADVHARYSARS